MKRTRLCQILGVKYPIVQGPMAWIAGPELVAAVSNAGGLGTLGPMAGLTTQEQANDISVLENNLRIQIRKTKASTDKPFAVNVPIGFGKQKAIAERMIGVVMGENVPIVVVSMGSPDLYTLGLHEAGCKVIHALSTVKQAMKAEAAGVDVVVCDGYEAGGHISPEELTTFVLVPQIVDAVKIPVIAAGGIADARGMVAAFALGAEGVYMGTRFMATSECGAHPAMKQAVVAAGDVSTLAFARRTGISRCLKNEYTARHIQMESANASFEELRAYERTGDDLGGWRRVPGAVLNGNLRYGSAPCGAIAGIVKEVIPAGEVIRRMVADYEAVVARLQ